MKQPEPSVPRSVLARVRRICLGLPETAEKTAWGSPTFRVKGRMFAMFLRDHHGDGRTALWLNAEPGVQAMLVTADPRRFFVPPYQGPKGWIGVELGGEPDWEEVTGLVHDAYRVTAPRLAARLDDLERK